MAKSLLEDTRVKLAVLWTFVMFNYVYADIMTLMDSSVLNELLTGTVGGLPGPGCFPGQGRREAEGE